MKFINDALSEKIGQNLIIFSLISIAISPPLANLFIGLSFIWSLLIPSLRTKLWVFLKSTPGYATLAFIAILISGLIYGIESNETIISAIWGWRKIIMLPVAAALFMGSDNKGKERLLYSFWFACLIFACYSFITAYFPNTNITNNPPGIIVRNYVTQGLFFSISILIALTYIFKANQDFKSKLLPIISVIIFLENIAQISIGRSGYVALIMMIIIFLWSYPLNISLIKKTGLIVLSVTLILLLLIATTSSRDRILLANSEFQSSLNKSEETSVGLRVIFWKNTLSMIPKYWITGTGTGGFEKAYTQHVTNLHGVDNTSTGDPHNQYLKILTEHGIFGLITFLVLLISLTQQKSLHPYKTIGVSTLIAFSITSLTNSHFSTFNEGQFIWIWVGALLAQDS